jgi:YidC/Oxa1 family membrane protein insertase
MDDQGKRLILALVLSFAFLFVYQKFFLPPVPVPVEESGVEVSPEEAPAVEAQIIEEPPEPPTAPLEPISGQEESILKVRTPRYSAELSNRGGVLKSLTLTKYKEELEDPESHVQMVHDLGNEKLRPLAVEFTAAGGPLGFSDALFRVEGSAIALEEGEQGKVVYRYRTQEGLEMVKTLTFMADSYEILCSVQVLNRSGVPLGGRTTLMWAPGLEQPVGEKEGKKLGSSRYGYKGALYLDGRKPQKIKSKKLEGTLTIEEPVIWIASTDMYFTAAILPGDGWTGAMARKGTGERVEVEVFSQMRLPPGGAVTLDATVYAGPKEMSSLRAVDPSLVKTIDLGMFGYIAKPLLDLLNFFHKFVGNYGLAIIILSTLIKIVFIPFSAISHRSMKKMSKLQPQINALRDRYKKDREKLNQEIMKLYQQNKVNPASGCLPIVVQIPVFFALYRALLGAIELRHAPFFFWITDLSAKDPLYITPIIMGATMFLQQKMTPTAVDPRQAQIMLFLPIIFTALFLSFPSGLVIYWTVNNVLTVAHQYFLNKGKEDEIVVAEPETGKGKGRKKK